MSAEKSAEEWASPATPDTPDATKAVAGNDGSAAGDAAAQESEGRSTSRSSAPQVALVALVVLALIASIVMLVTDSMGALKLALLASLWASIIGFFLVSRYRRIADAAEAELDNEIALHDAELNRMDAERRASEERAKRLSAGAADVDADTLAEIREELAALRSHLEDLSGWVMAEEPAVVRAEARRILEIEDEVREVGARPVETPTQEPVEAQGEPDFKSDFNVDPASDRKPDAEPGREQSAAAQSPASSTAAQPMADRATGSRSGAGAGSGSSSSVTVGGSAAPSPTAVPRGPRPFDTGAFAAVRWDEGGTKEKDNPLADYFAGLEKQAAAQKAAADSLAGTGSRPSNLENSHDDESVATPPATAEYDTAAEKAADNAAEKAAEFEARHGRRRRDENANSISVADLLARRTK